MKKVYYSIKEVSYIRNIGVLCMKKVYYSIKKVSYIRNRCPIYEKGVL